MKHGRNTEKHFLHSQFDSLLEHVNSKKAKSHTFGVNYD